MTSLEAALAAIHAELVRENLPFALVGGLAVSVRTDGERVMYQSSSDSESGPAVRAVRLR
ncbi:MAG: hypothetical protein ABI565_04775 [Vicinamibacteria bacterium]